MTHFAPKSKRPLVGLRTDIADALNKQYGTDGKGKPDFKAARAFVVKKLEDKLMTTYRKDKTDEMNLNMKKRANNILRLQASRSKALGGH